LPHRINSKILAEQVRVIDENDQQLGILPLEEALKNATDRELDLVEIAPKAQPPVCRLLVYSKFLYEWERRERQNKKQQHRPPHQLRFAPNIADHDFETKRRQAEKFLQKGDKVQIIVQMKGRQNAHPERAQQLVERFLEQLPACLDNQIKKSGNRVHAVLSPDRQAIEKAQKEALATEVSSEE
jgi:translation initiation factor IF-3